ncbi:MAG: archease [Elusimicrobiota bacterium]
MTNFVPIQHIADVGITAYAKDLNKLFVHCAEGMFSLLVDLKTVRPRVKEVVKIKSANQEELLIKWLNELLYFTETHKEVFCKFKIIKLSARNLIAEVWGEKIEPGRHQFGLEIKAATYHNLEIKHTPRGYETTIIFDI